MTAKQQFLLLGVLPAGSGLLLLVAGFNFRLSVLYTLGLLALAFAALATGIASCLYRRIVFINPNRRRFDLIVRQGVAAIPFGGTYILGGFMILAVAIAQLAGMSADAMRDAIIARPGLLLAPLGVAILSYSLGFATGFPAAEDAKRGATWNTLMSIPARLGALILFVIGVALLGIGGWELLHPAEFDEWIKVLLHGSGV